MTYDFCGNTTEPITWGVHRMDGEQSHQAPTLCQAGSRVPCMRFLTEAPNGAKRCKMSHKQSRLFYVSPRVFSTILLSPPPPQRYPPPRIHTCGNRGPGRRGDVLEVTRHWCPSWERGSVSVLIFAAPSAPPCTPLLRNGHPCKTKQRWQEPEKRDLPAGGVSQRKADTLPRHWVWGVTNVGSPDSLRFGCWDTPALGLGGVSAASLPSGRFV